MSIKQIIQKKSLPSFCTANFDVIETIIYYCRKKKLPCLFECTSNQVNQFGGYSNYKPKQFIDKVQKLRKKNKLNRNQLFLGGDHLGPLPWKNTSSKIALKNSINLINNYLKNDFDKIHIDASIKCKDDILFNETVIFKRTEKIFKYSNLKKKIKNKFLIVGTEVPFSGSNNNDDKLIVTNYKNIVNEFDKFKFLLKKIGLVNKKFGLVIEPGMKYMDFSIIKPELNKFLKSKKFSIKNNFVYEAHSTDYQPKKVLKKLVQNNFKFLKVGPELTYNFTRSLFFMNRLEKKFLKKKNSNFKKNLYLSMKKNKIYWKDYYKKNKNNMLLNSKLDRSRYYLNSKDVVHSLKLLKQNINSINKKKN